MQENKQLEVTTQFEKLCDELAENLVAAQSFANHILWLKEQVLKEYAAMQEAKDSLEVFTEKEAAEKLKLKPKQLGDLRRAQNLPFVRAGALVRYSKENLAEIVKILTVNNDKKPKK